MESERAQDTEEPPPDRSLSNAIAALKRQRSRQAEARLRAGQAWTDYDLVFTDDFGEPLTGSRITERRLRPLGDGKGCRRSDSTTCDTPPPP